MSGNLLYFELTENTRFFLQRARGLGCKFLTIETPYGIAGLGSTHSVLRAIQEMREEPAMDFCFTLRKPNEECLRNLESHGLQRLELTVFVMNEERIKHGDLLICNEIADKYFVIAQTSKKERQQLSREPLGVYRDRTAIFAQLGIDFTIENADFARFSY